MKAFETLHPGEQPLELSWYIEAMCHALSEVRSGATRRLVITVPPRHLKSVTASVAFVAWLLGRNPAMKVMVASYSQDLARLHSNQCRVIVEADWYKRDFPGTRISSRGNRALELETTKGGMRKAVSVGGSITGFGADLIIVDDCMKADDARSVTMRQEVRAWFDSTLQSRLDDKASGKILSIQQRLHGDDLPAYMLEKGYEHLNLPAVAQKDETIPLGAGRVHTRKAGDLLNPSRENRETLEQLRRDLGPVVFSAQYLQDPAVPEGNLIRLEWFGTYDVALRRSQYIKVIQSWDTGFSSAPTSDYSACTTWGFDPNRKKWYLLDVLRQRLDYPDLRRAVLSLKERWEADVVLIEKAGSGISLGQDFRKTGRFLPIMMTPTTDKVDRFNGCLGEIEGGHFLLPREAPWLDDFTRELKEFPLGRHDDQADSLSQFVGYQMRKWRYVMTEYDRDGFEVRCHYSGDERPW